MKNEKILKALNQVDDKYIEEAASAKRSEKKASYKRKSSYRRPLWMIPVAAALILVIMGGAIFWPGKNPMLATAYAITEAQYPEKAPYPLEEDFRHEDTGELDKEAYEKAWNAWSKQHDAQLQQTDGYTDDLNAFFTEITQQFLSNTSGENLAYSPLNVYMILGILAEISAGNSRQQILDLLDIENMEILRTQASALWNANYSNDGAVTSILSSSLWLNDNIDFKQNTMDTLAKTYYTSSYQGKMGSNDFNKALQSWYNEQTRGRADDPIPFAQLDSETILALVTTFYYHAKWQTGDAFPEDKTTQGTFHAPDQDESCDFMHRSKNQNYYRGKNFSAIANSVEGGGQMYFILPDEEISIDTLLNDRETMDFILSNGKWDNKKYLEVNLSVPKFDITTNLDLTSGLKKLGVTDVFSSLVSDFSPMAEGAAGIYVSNISDETRIKLGEEDSGAPTDTILPDASETLTPEGKTDLTFDRPFMFAITGADGLPLFIGIVNHAAL